MKLKLVFVLIAIPHQNVLTHISVSKEEILMTKRNRRPQKQKSSKVRAVQGLRRSSAAEPHRSPKAYRRRNKYNKFEEE